MEGGTKFVEDVVDENRDHIYIYIEMKRVVRSMGKQVDWVFFLSFIRALKLDSYQKDFFSPLHFYFYFYFNSVSLSHR